MTPTEGMKMEWISVKDRLPEDYSDIIGYCRLSPKHEWMITPLLYEKGDWAYLTAYNEGYGYAFEVSHWMKLPESPPESPKK